MRSRFRKWSLSVLTMASVATVVLFAAGWQSALASSVRSVFVSNGTSKPVPVSETNLDANGNIKVAQQGTASVVVTNTTPVPVGGSVGITGTPSVSIAGTPSVSVSGTPSVSISGTPSVSLSGTPSVDVGNFPTAPTTVRLADGTGSLDALQGTTLFSADVSAYREVTLYLNQIETVGSETTGLQCIVDSSDSSLDWRLDSFATGTTEFVNKTYDPAPPSVTIRCTNDQASGTIAYDWMVAGRTG